MTHRAREGRVVAKLRARRHKVARTNAHHMNGIRQRATIHGIGCMTARRPASQSPRRRTDANPCAGADHDAGVKGP